MTLTQNKPDAGAGKRRILKSIKSLKWYEWVMIAIMVIVAAYSVVTSFMGVNPVTGKADTNPPWLAIINFVSAIAGIMCIFLCAKASISNFMFGALNTIVYIVYLIYWKVWATATLEIVVYMPMNIISWIIWARHRDVGANDHLTKSRKMNWWQNLITVAGIVGLTILSHFTLESLTGSSWANIGEAWQMRDFFTWLDAITFSIGIVAVLLECFRFREQYVWWLITDIVAVAMYIVKTPFDPVYLTKKSIYLIMAVIGLINWIRLQKLNNVANE